MSAAPRRSVAALAALALLLAVAVTACGQRPPRHPQVEAEDGRVRLPLARVGDGGVHFFTYVATGGQRVSFLVRTDGEGTLHTHLDACFSCYRYRMGYVVEGREVVCRACRYAYPLADPTWDFIGACAPIPVRSTVEDGYLTIERSVLEQAARFF